MKTARSAVLLLVVLLFAVTASAGTIARLGQLGVVFVGPMPGPPHRVARMHNVLPNSRALVRLLAKRARQAGVRIFVDTAANGLVAEDGRIVAVETNSGGMQRRFEARRGVILTTGDFSGSEALRRRHLAEALWEIDAANPDSTGDGQRLGSEVGASIVNADLVWGPEIRFIAPEGRNLLDRLPPSPAFARLVLWSLKHLPAPILRPFLMMFVTTHLAPNLTLLDEGAILVNAEGRRFVEAGEDPAFAMARQPGKVAYFLLDDRVAETFSAWPHYISTAPGLAYAYFADYRRNRKDITRSAPSIEALAARLGIDGAALVETVREHNAAGQSQIEQAPFHALGPAKPWIMFTEGGLGVDTALRVLDGEGRPIPGLYAAGSAGQGGLILDGHGHHLGWASGSGRLAARSAAGAN